jgi:hypothetical protein
MVCRNSLHQKHFILRQIRTGATFISQNALVTVDLVNFCFISTVNGSLVK